MSKIRITSRLDKKRILELENKLIKRGEDFLIKQTNYSVTYLTDKMTYCFNSSATGFGAIKIFSKVKADIKKNLLENKFEIKNVKPLYYDFDMKKFDCAYNSFLNCTEMDINKAYLTSANMQNIISKEIYDKLLLVSREIRLRSLGAIAVTRTITAYEAGKIKEVYSEQDKELRAVWFMICGGVGEIMNDLIKSRFKDEFLFFWVDNLFMLHKRDFDSTLIKVKYPVNIDYQKDNYIIKLLIDKKRNFALPYYYNKQKRLNK